MRLCLWLYFCLVIGSSVSRGAEESEWSPEELRSRLQRIDSNINDTKEQMRNIRDASYLADLYFVLAEFLVDRSRLLYQLKIADNPQVPVEELDFTLEKRPKEEAVAVYDSFLDKFPSDSRRDRALFFKAHELRELGRAEDMLEVYRRISREFPTSVYWAEAQLAIGDVYFNEKKDFAMAAEYFQAILTKDLSSFHSLAHYKLGWCYINGNQFAAAYQAFSDAILTAEQWLQKKEVLSSDIRREALLALVWPYSELTTAELAKVHSPSLPAVEHFRSLSFSFTDYLELLRRLSRRMKIKKKWQDSAAASMELLRLSSDTQERVEQLDSAYQILRNSIKDVKSHKFLKAIDSFLQETSEQDPAFLTAKNISQRLELILRDLATSMQQASQVDRSWQEPAILAYDVYLRTFSPHRQAAVMRFNRANLLFQSDRPMLAAMDYEQLARGRGIKSIQQTKQSLIKAALESYLRALQKAELSLAERAQARNALRGLGIYFLKQYPKNPAAPTVLYNIGQSYFNERDFVAARKYFRRFLLQYPEDARVSMAANQILDGHNQRENFKDLLKDGQWILRKTKITNSSLRQNIKDILAQAQLYLVRKASGDFTKEDYAEKVLQMASRYKGSGLGDKALYEAFVLFRSQRSEQMYQPGEQLLLNHANSKYAKQAASNMVFSALSSADFARAARYLEYYGKNFPNDKESSMYLQQAAELRRWIRDFRSAKRIYRLLKDQKAVAEMDFLAADWASLQKTASSIEQPWQSLWMAHALHGLGKPDQAKQILEQNMSQIRNSGESSVIVESLYLATKISLQEYSQLRIKKNSQTEKLVAEKTKLLQSLNENFSVLLASKDPEYSLAALAGLGESSLDFAKFLGNISAPSQLNATQKKLFQEALSQQAVTYTQQADSYFKKCLDLAKQNRIYSRYTKMCEQRNTQFQVSAVTTTFSEIKDADMLELRRKLFDQPRSAKIYQEMIRLSILRQQYGNAIALIRRGQELFPEEGQFYAYDAVVSLHLGEFFAAGKSLKQAMDRMARDPGLAILANNLDYYFGFRKQKKTWDKDWQELLPRWLL